MRLGFIGTGTIASAVVQGLAGRGHEIRISARSKARADALASDIPEVQIAELQEILDHSDVVFLGLMLEAAPAILEALPFPRDLRVVSFMAGAGLDEVADLVAPAHASAVMMPFPGIAQGGSAIMALGDGDLLDRIFAPQNTLFMLRDAGELDAYLCAQAVLSPVAQLTLDAGNWLSARVSDPAQGEAFLRMLISSSLAGGPAADLIAALNTPGGYNQRLRQHMEGAGLGTDLAAGLDALES
ncbi:NAD(P)-binding domain-containing protein [Pseudophaeobacter sp. EL27]|uniref:NAD(P)-binding domain-containing protein n=1 Tax=Pseudophaeobacter sp. EL27 TaxID=2107580 RepID=UPI000EFC297E|nr:NAD(P)-binding domain-containing protein [Pseudophaeobacter sp. EL27]